MANYENSTFAPDTKKMKAADYSAVEKARDIWFSEACSACVPIYGLILQCHAEEVAKGRGHLQFTSRSSMDTSGVPYVERPNL